MANKPEVPKSLHSFSGRVSDFVRLPSENDIIGSSFKTRYSEVPRPTDYDIKFIPTKKEVVVGEKLPTENKEEVFSKTRLTNPIIRPESKANEPEVPSCHLPKKGLSLGTKIGIVIALVLIVAIQIRYIFYKLELRHKKTETVQVNKVLTNPKIPNDKLISAEEEGKKFRELNSFIAKSDLDSELRRAHLFDTVFKRIKSEIQDLSTMKIQDIKQNLLTKYGSELFSKLWEDLIQKLNEDPQIKLKIESSNSFYVWTG